MTDTNRKSGRWVAVGLVLFLAAGVSFALGMWWWGRAPQGPIRAIRAIDGEHVAVIRQGFEERGYTHLGVWNDDGVMLWSEALFGVQDEPALVVADDLLLVMVTEARGNPALHAFDRANGEFRWKFQQRKDSGPVPLHLGDGVVWLVASDGTVTELDLTTGEVRGERTAGDPRPWPAAPPVLAVRDDQGVCTPAACRTVDGMVGYDATEGAVWVHTTTELAVLRGPTLDPSPAVAWVGEPRDAPR